MEISILNIMGALCFVLVVWPGGDVKKAEFYQ